MPTDDSTARETEPLSKGRLLVVDGHAYAYRAFHAIRSLRGPAGEPTNAIYGFVKMLGRLRAWLKPGFTVVVWDGGLAAERLQILPGYKAQRPPMPADLEKQMDQIVAYLRAAGLASVCQDGVEADDWIGALASGAAQQGYFTVIASSDKDFMQLVSSRVGLANPNDKAEIIWSAENVRAKAGVQPEQIVDWLSLVGDSVDNIPGARGIGPKTAADLLNQFGSLDGVYARLPEVKSERIREVLKTSAEILRRNQRMIRLNTELPGDFGVEQFREGPLDRVQLLELYRSWGFKGLTRELENSTAVQPMLL